MRAANFKIPEKVKGKVVKTDRQHIYTSSVILKCTTSVGEWWTTCSWTNSFGSQNIYFLFYLQIEDYFGCLDYTSQMLDNKTHNKV